VLNTGDTEKVAKDIATFMVSIVSNDKEASLAYGIEKNYK